MTQQPELIILETNRRINMIKGIPGPKSIVLLSVCVLLTIAAFAQTSAQDYPQWRGKDRDGSASDFAEPKTWPERLTRRWKVEVGEGYATPLVIGQRVYCFARRAGKEVLMALDAKTGKVEWQTGYAAAALPPGSAAAPHGDGPKATPLFYRGKLYTLGLGGIVSAFDATTGKLSWQTPAPPEPPYFGMAVSPLGEQNLIIVHPGDFGPLTAFDTDTGAIKWKARGDSAWASPIIVELGGTRQVVSMTQQSVISVAVADGTVLWEYPWKPSGLASTMTPIVYGDTILVGSQKMGVTALKPFRRDNKWITEIVWETKDVSLLMSNPVLIGDTLFGLSERSSGQFFALDVKTGKVLWLGPPRQATNTAVVKAGDLLFFLDDDAELIVARANRAKFEPLKRYTVAGSATWAQPAISGNRIFVKDVSTLALWTVN